MDWMAENSRNQCNKDQSATLSAQLIVVPLALFYTKNMR